MQLGLSPRGRKAVDFKRPLLSVLPAEILSAETPKGQPTFIVWGKEGIQEKNTDHYERCWKYYCLPTGWANFGVTSEEELHLTRKLFWGIFDSLAHKVWAPGAGGCLKGASLEDLGPKVEDPE